MGFLCPFNQPADIRKPRNDKTKRPILPFKKVNILHSTYFLSKKIVKKQRTWLKLQATSLSHNQQYVSHRNVAICIHVNSCELLRSKIYTTNDYASNH